MYLLDFPYHGSFNIIGRQKNGQWFSYVDYKIITNKYFNGKQAWKGSEGVVYYEVQVKGDTIIIPYEYKFDKWTSSYKGELRFKWDDKAQWFGVEKITY